MAIAGIEKKPPLRMAGEVAFKVVTHPFNVAVMLGVLFSMYQMRLPTTLDTMTEWLANAAAPSPCSCSESPLRSRKATAMPREVPYLVVIKLIIHPLLVWVLLSSLGTYRSDVGLRRDRDGGPAARAEHLRHLDTSTMSGSKRASACVLMGTVVSVFTLTGFLWFDPDGTTAARPVSDVG